jgi:hypothetical protein
MLAEPGWRHLGLKPPAPLQADILTDLLAEARSSGAQLDDFS